MADPIAAQPFSHFVEAQERKSLEWRAFVRSTTRLVYGNAQDNAGAFGVGTHANL